MGAFGSLGPRGALGDGAWLVLIWSVLDRVGPAGCCPSGCCGAMGILMHSSTLQLKHDP